MAQAVAFQAALTRLGFNAQSIAGLNANGVQSVEDLINLTDKDTAQILKIVRAGPPPIIVPYLAQKRLDIFCFWATRRNRLNEPLNPVLFDQVATNTYGSMMALSTQEEDLVVKPPGEFKKDTKWKNFKEGAIAYLNAVRGKHDIPLAYVIREQDIPVPNQVYQSEHHRLISITPLQGIEFEDDNGRVFDLLKSWTINGHAWTWMRAFNSTRNGRSAWLALINHFEGDAQRDRVKDQAYASIVAAKYYGERKKFSFETYVTIHQDAYADLVQYGEIISEEKRVRDLLSNIKDNSPAANAAKGTILATPTLRNSFSNAVAHLATTLQLGLALQDSRNISSASTYKGGRGSGRDGKRGGRGGRGGRGRGRNIYLGSYSPDQWRKLSADDKKRVYEGRQKSADTSQPSNSQGQSRTIATTNTNVQSSAASAVSNTQMEEAILQGALQGSAAVGEKRPNTDSAGSQMSRRRINAILTSQRKRINRNVSEMKHSVRYKDHSNVVSGQCELDSHADTCVAGRNCIILEDTGQTVNVSAFSDKHKTFKDIPIVTAATAYDDERNGTTYILILGQAIYMGEDMSNTLICPNQLRKHGVIVDDCPSHLAPTNNPSSHSIICQDDGQELRIGLSLQGVTSYFHTRTPTEEELETCRWIHLSNEHNWDPHSQEFHNQEVNFKELQDLDREPDDRYIYHTVSISTSTKPSLDMIYSDLSEAFDDRCIINVSSTRTSSKQGSVNAETLAKRWNIGIEAAKRTIQCTTQKGIRSTLHPIERRFRTKQAQLRYNQLAGRHGSFYTDTFFSKATSLNNYKMAQIYVNDLAFSKVYPMAVRSEAGDTLQAFIHDVGIPHSLRSDDAPELMHGKFKQICKDYGINCGYTEPYSPWQNRAEGAVRELKRHVHRKMVSKRIPHRLWDFCCKWSCDVRNKTSGTIFALENRTPFEATLGQTPDISSLAPFDFYDYIWYYDEVAQFPEPRRKVGRWLGEATNFGQAMCYWILSNTAQVIVRSSVQPIPEESHDDILRQEIAELNVKIQEKLGDSAEEKYNLNTVRFGDTYDNSVTPDYPPMEPENSMPEADDWDVEAYDQYISAEVLLPKDGKEVLGQVVARKRDADGNPIGRGNSNPILDTRLYEVKFSDGNVAEYSANVIAECIYSQVDNEGRQYVLMDDIIDYVRTDEAVDDSDIFQISLNGNIHGRRTTKGWKLCIRWKDGSTSWENLKDMKESYPVQVAEFAVSQGISEAPAFRWWVKDVLRRRNRIIKAVKSRYIKRTHKYGIQLPKTIEEAYELDRITNTDYWHQAILREMKNNAVAFKILEDDEDVPVGSQWIPFHMIFDIKCDFTRKARFVAGGHWTDAPTQLTYSSVVTRDSVRIAFLIAALNDLDIMAADVGNAYLQAPVREKVYTTAGPEFGPTNIGKRVVVIRAMYGLKSSGAAWHAKLSETLKDMGFTPSYADADVWYKPATKPDGFEYYEYLLVYVDDLLVVSAAPRNIMLTIQKAYRLKEEPCQPINYLGAKIKTWSIPHETRTVWSMSCTQYLKEAIKNVELELAKTNQALKGKPKTPMQPGYRPELDVSSVLAAEQANYYQSLIGILRWAVELGRIDINIDVALLSSYLAQPRVGHLEQALHIFSYLKHHMTSHLVFDPNYIAWESAGFQDYDWTEFYGNVKEAIPPNAPPPRGLPVQINAFSDADHAGNKVTRRSHTGILIYLNCAPVIWYSKAQSTVEASTFGSEFIAMRITVEMIESLRYKLRMFGIPIDGPANVFCDNSSVVTNTTIPTSTLKKKHNAVAYHRVREAVAAGIVRIAKVHTTENLADLLTKPLNSCALKQLVQRILW